MKSNLFNLKPKTNEVHNALLVYLVIENIEQDYEDLTENIEAPWEQFPIDYINTVLQPLKDLGVTDRTTLGVFLNWLDQDSGFNLTASALQYKG